MATRKRIKSVAVYWTPEGEKEAKMVTFHTWRYHPTALRGARHFVEMASRDHVCAGCDPGRYRLELERE